MEVNLNPHTYNTPETDVSSTYPLSLSRAGGCGCWRAEGTIWSNPSTGWLGPQCVGALCWLFQQPCFPKARKKDTKRGALSHGSVQKPCLLQEPDLFNLKAAASHIDVFKLVQEMAFKVEIEFSYLYKRLSLWNCCWTLPKCILGCRRSYFLLPPAHLRMQSQSKMVITQVA